MIVKDLEANFINYDLEVHLEILNTNDSHFSTEERGFNEPILILTIVQFVILTLSIKKLINMYQKDEEMDYPYLVVNLALFF